MTSSTRPTAAPLLRLVRSELALVVPRPRTWITLATLLVVPLLTAFSLHALGGERAVALNVLLVSGSGYLAPTLVVPVVLVAADAFGAERAHHTLDQLRLAPVGTARLVLIKSAGVVVTAVLTGIATTGVALLGGVALLPTDPYGPGATLGRALVIGCWLAGQTAGLGILLLPLSMAVRRTAGVVAAGLLLTVLGLLRDGPWWLRAVAPNGNWDDALTALSQIPADWSGLGATTVRAAVYVVLGTGLTAWLLNRRDG